MSDFGRDAEHDLDEVVKELRKIRTELVLENAILQVIAFNTTPVIAKPPSKLTLTFGTPVPQ